MNEKYDAALYIRITGIVLSIISLSLAFIKPFEFVLNTMLVYSLLVGAAVLIMIGDLIVIKSAPEEEFSTKKQRREAVYDVITTAVVVGLFIAFYVTPFFIEHLW